MILPFRTSIRPWRTPYANYALIVINVIIFVFQLFPGSELWVRNLMLVPTRPHLWQFVTYAFLHGGFMHIFFNMFFLYLFGNNVNDKLGSFCYVCFYLAGGIFSGIGHTLLSHNPALGASGAVAAVAGAYMVLFPQTLITIIYWFIIIGTMEVSALYFIAFKMIILDNVIARYTPNVAYDAHLSGYAFGISASLLLLASGLVSSSGVDLWSMIKQWNRRRNYRDAVSNGYDPFSGRKSRKIKAKEVKVKTAAEKDFDEKVQQIRNDIGKRIAERNLSAAAALYLELVKLDSKQVPPRQYLLDIANQLVSENKHAESAAAYEKFIDHYRNYEYIEQVELMLGIIYSRYLQKRESAIKLLETARNKLTDEGQLKMCNDELDKLKG